MYRRERKRNLTQATVANRDSLSGCASKGEVLLRGGLHAIEGVEYGYEDTKLHYRSKAGKSKKYSPDFTIYAPVKIFVEYKQFFRNQLEADKYLDVMLHNPDISLVFVVKDPSRRILNNTIPLGKWLMDNGFKCYTPSSFLVTLKESPNDLI